MNKTTDTKTKSQPATKHDSGSFFGKESSSSFFSAENETISRRPFFTQAKLSVSHPNDASEKEADAAADAVVQRITKPSVIQAKNTTAPLTISPYVQSKSISPEPGIKINKKEKELDEETAADPLQRKPIFDSAADPLEGDGNGMINRKGETPGATVPNSFESRVHDSKSSGQSMPDPVRGPMEQAFNTDFSGVNLHTDSNAAQMASDIGAQAFTHGNDIYFNEGKYEPESNEGKHLLAHELTHTIQQGATPPIQPKLFTTGSDADQIHRKTEVPLSVPAPRDFTSLTTPEFTPSTTVDEYIAAAGNKGADVNVSFGNMASGSIKIRKNKDGFETVRKGAVPLHIDFLKPLTDAGIQPALAIDIDKNKISGYLTIGVGKNLVPSSKEAIPGWVSKNPLLMKWSGLDKIRFDNVVNTIEDGKLKLEVKNMKARFGGFVDSSFDLGLVNTSPTVSGHIELNIKNISGSLDFQRDEAGNLKGKGEAQVLMKNFKGGLKVEFLNGIFDIQGKVSYTTEKLSGEVNIVITDAAKAKTLALQQMEPEQINQQALENSGMKQPEAGPVPGPRAIAGWGTLNFSFNKWLTGLAKVIVDNEGHITVHGEITPPATVTLFDAKPYQSPAFLDIHPTFRWGIPYVADVHIGLDFLLYAKAQIGPALLKDIKVVGTYSTDPLVFNDFRIQATLSLMGYASLVFTFGAHAGVGILGFDIDLGGELSAEAGIRAYLEATPVIGYREVADPVAGKKGEFYLKGQAELAAQPFLALSGLVKLFVDSPWPIPNKTWKWPMFNKEYPLPGEFGIGLKFGEYIVGSGEWPGIEWSEVKFDHDKFADDLLEERVPPKKARPEDAKTGFSDANKGEQPPPPPAVAGPAPVPGAPPGTKPPPPKPDVLARWTKGCEALKGMKDKAEEKPYDEQKLKASLAKIKNGFKFVRLEATPSGANWAVYAEMEGINNADSIIGIKGDIKPGEAVPGTVAADGKEPPRKLEDITFVQPDIKMDQGTHSIIVEIKSGAFTVKMRSREVFLKDAALSAKQELTNKMSVASADRAKSYAVLIGVLNKIITDIDDLPHTVEIKLGEAKAPGKSNPQLEKEILVIEVAKLGERLKVLGQLSHADSLEELVNEVIPDKRFLPIKGTPSEYIRGLFYEGMYKTEWKAMRTKLQTAFNNDENIAKRIEEAISTKNTTLWAKLISDNIVELDSEPSDTYNYKTVKYDVDHIIPVATMWNEEGLKKGDEERKHQLLKEENLRYIPKKNNIEKGSGGDFYQKYVEKSFTSKLAEENNPTARTIKGDPFLGPNGESI